MKGLVCSTTLCEQYRPIIGVFLTGTNAVDIFAASVEAIKAYDFFVYVPSIDDRSRSTFRRLGVRFSTELSFAILNAPQMAAALTFGCLPHPAHESVLILTALMQELGIPVLDVQHGLFQWGINFTDDSLEQGFSNATGISMPVTTVADKQLRWHGENEIGYPRYKPNRPPAKNEMMSSILVATNSNWHIYAEEERQNLLCLLRQLFTARTHVNFIWKPHPAELSGFSMLRQLVDEIKAAPETYSNVEIVGEADNNLYSLTELVASCRAGIATVGTSILDFEMLGKPCAIFDCSAVAALNASLIHGDMFHDLPQLLNWLDNLDENTKPPVTGYLHPFDQDCLIRHIDTAIAESLPRRIPRQQTLPILMRYKKMAC
ncbi:hypothetical protein ACFO1V_10335 [Daeguia caeni]|uniref:UDP-N-acetylglucosamine 2-epimerase domain-containing protein n=1 Tax=Daeguia caeni TaxID=439612 RepID=A0ABV9H854_9HYPH